MKIESCPHCGSTKGMYSKYTLYGVREDYSFDGSPPSGNLDNVWQKGGKNLYCYECDRYICTVKDWEVVNGD